jgi:uroporphyrinogen-III decarboxylase
MSHFQQLKEAGFPIFFVGGTEAPFDFIGDFLRGRKNVMLDMYRRPEKLLEAVGKLLPMAIETGVMGAKMSGNPRVFIAVHGGIEAFMSVEQYKRFYWPTFRELLHGLVKGGCNPVVLVEGGSTSRLEFLRDVPPGKVCYIFEDVDLKKAKESLSGIACIAGNVPMRLLATGTPEDIKVYCKMLIDTLGRDGGYIMSSGGSMDNARAENIKVMIDFTKEYGVY